MKFEDKYKIVHVKDNSYFWEAKSIGFLNYNGTCYYLGYLVHREDGPAVEYLTGDKNWYMNGKRHREDGPAVEYYYDSTKRYYLNNQHYTEKMYWSIINTKKKQEILDSVL